MAELVAGGLSARRARKAHAVLRQVLASAVEGGRLSRNVAVGMKLPKVQRTEMHFLDAEQVEALADRLEHTRRAALANRQRTQRGPEVVRFTQAAGG